MKKLIVILLPLFMLPAWLQAQDKLLFQNGNELQVKVLEVTPDSVRFTAADSAGVLIAGKRDIFMITYQNGTKEVFPVASEIAAQPAGSEPFYSSQQLYTMGQQDARRYFKTGGVYWGTLGATVGGIFLAGPLPGFGVGLACAVSPPQDKNIIAPDPALKLEPAYLDGYKNQAKKRKMGSAAGGFATGLGVVTAGLILIIASIY